MDPMIKAGYDFANSGEFEKQAIWGGTAMKAIWPWLKSVGSKAWASPTGQKLGLVTGGAIGGQGLVEGVPWGWSRFKDLLRDEKYDKAFAEIERQRPDSSRLAELSKTNPWLSKYQFNTSTGAVAPRPQEGYSKWILPALLAGGGLYLTKKLME